MLASDGEHKDNLTSDGRPNSNDAKSQGTPTLEPMRGDSKSRAEQTAAC